MIYVIYFIHVVVCFFLILVVLLQQGKGADLSVFGGGATMTAFGARGATTLLHKLTVGSFVIFILTTLGAAVLQSSGTGSSVMRGAAQKTAPAVPEPAQPAPAGASGASGTSGAPPPAPPPGQP